MATLDALAFWAGPSSRGPPNPVDDVNARRERDVKQDRDEKRSRNIGCGGDDDDNG